MRYATIQENADAMGFLSHQFKIHDEFRLNQPVSNYEACTQITSAFTTGTAIDEPLYRNDPNRD